MPRARKKYLRRGKLDGQQVQMLMDAGCDHTMVLASLVTLSVVDHGSKAPVLCVHGDTSCASQSPGLEQIISQFHGLLERLRLSLF